MHFFVFITGCCIGSFLNVLIYRIPKQIPFWSGRSFCPSCRTTIKPYDLIPILSYLFLLGRCRNCRSRISCRYPIIEILTGVIAMLVFENSGFTVLSLIYFIFSAILIVIAFIDIDTMTIPNGLILSLIIPTAAILFFTEHPDIISRIIGFFIISVLLYLINFLIPNGFGGGDIKLIAVCGFMLGWQNVLVAFIIGLIVGGIHGAILLIKNIKNSHRHIAFGQYLCIGAFIALLYGKNIINAYVGLFGL